MANLQIRHGTAAQWAAANPVLKNGEPGAETDTKKLKVGDGTTTWNSLAYVGGGITALTGDVTASGSGSVAATIANSAVTLAKIQNAAANAKLLGSGAAGSGAPYAELTLGTALSMSGTTLNVSGAASGLDARSSVYPPFTPSGVDCEFAGSDLAAFTAVNNGNGLATATETNDLVSFLVGTSTSPMQAFVKATTVSANDIIEVCFRGAGRLANFHAFGLIMADGDTFGAGSQVLFWFFPVLGTTAYQLAIYTNYTTQGTNSTFSVAQNTNADLFLRLKYEGSNNWSGWTSPDGVSWANVTGTLSRTMTPTHVGFVFTTGGATTQFAWSARFFRKTT